MTDVQGRQHIHVPWFTPQQRVTVKGIALVLVAVLLWWVACAVTGRADWSTAGVRESLHVVVKGRAADGGWGAVAVFAGLMVAAAVLAGWLSVRRGDRSRASVGMSNRAEVRAIAGEDTARGAAKFTRERSIKSGRLDPAKCPIREIGWQPGTSHGEPVVLTTETQVGVVGATGMGKTRYLLRGAAADAPGALIVTTTKLRDYTAVFAERQRLGRVLVFDPLDVSGWAEPMYWDPVAGADDPAVAYARGQAFAGGMDNDDASSSAGQFFNTAVATVIARLLMAAAVSGGSMYDVRRWAVDLASDGQKAVDILRRLPDQVFANTLNKYVRGDAKTTANIQVTLAQKIEVMMSPVVMAALVPSPGRLPFDPDEFVRSTDTLVIVTDDNARANVAPLSTMLLGELTDAAKVAAARGGMLDPAIRIVGDEIANVAPLPKLPAMLSDSRGTGIQWIIAIQSLAALTARWGEHPAKVILSNLNAVIVLGGLQDTEALERFSSLAGRSEVLEGTTTLTKDGREVQSTNYAIHERAVFRPEEIAHLPQGEAFMQLRNGKSLILKLTAYDERVAS
jgi:type IV secretion system protein VirD4